MEDKKKNFKITVTHGGKSSKKDEKIEIDNNDIIGINDIENSLRDSADLHLIISMSRMNNDVLIDAGMSEEELEICNKNLNVIMSSRTSLYMDEWIYNHFYFEADDKLKRDLMNYTLPFLDEIFWLSEEDVHVSTFDGQMHFHFIRETENNTSNRFRIFTYMTMIDYDNHFSENIMEPLNEMIFSLDGVDEDDTYKDIRIIGMDSHIDEDCIAYTVAFSFSVEYSKAEVKQLKKDHGR